MQRFAAWFKRQQGAVGLPELAAYPTAFDAVWFERYGRRFVGATPFRRRAIDSKSLAIHGRAQRRRPTNAAAAAWLRASVIHGRMRERAPSAEPRV